MYAISTPGVVKAVLLRCSISQNSIDTIGRSPRASPYLPFLPFLLLKNKRQSNPMLFHGKEHFIQLVSQGENAVANPSLFSSSVPGTRIAYAITQNDAGGTAYVVSDEANLAQMALTGTFNDTFYANATTQFERIFEYAKKVSPQYLAQVAVYAHEHGYMKDTPTFLLAVLSTRDVALTKQIFNRIITNGKMLRNFVQFIRSGVVGRKSLGSALKKLIQNWLLNQPVARLISASIGNNPSLADVVQMVHPTPNTPEQQDFFAWLVKGKESQLPMLRDYQRFTTALKANQDIPEGLLVGLDRFPKVELGPLPAVPFEMLMALDMPVEQWKELAARMTWTQLRLNLNNLKRHGVFDNDETIDMVARRLGDRDEVLRTKVFPYQIFTAFLHGDDLPKKIQDALANAMDYALHNVPEITTTVAIGTDVSASMSSSVTGQRKGATSKVSNVQVAGLFTAAVMRTCKRICVVPVDTGGF